MDSSLLRRLGVLFLLLCAQACSGKSAGAPANGTIDGVVVVTAPVTGAVVTAYSFDPDTGARGAQLASSEPTAEDGAFHLDLGIHYGPIVLSARGVGATYVEPATGVTVAWDSTTELLATYVHRDESQELVFDLKRADAIAAFVVSPWSTLAVGYADARAAAGEAYTDALARSHGLLRDHLELDFWAVLPSSLTDGTAGGWNDQVQFGAELAGWSQLVRRMAKDSNISEGGLTSLQLLDVLQRDLSDGLFDGHAGSSILSLGSCAGVCLLDSCSLRGTYGEAVLAFLGSPEINTSGIQVTDAEALVGRMATRAANDPTPGDPGRSWWVGGTCSLDTAAPEVTITGFDESNECDGDIGGTLQCHGAVVAHVRLFDAIKLSAQYELTFLRGTTDLGVAFADVDAVDVSAREKQLTLTIHTDQLPDGPLTLRVVAHDQATPVHDGQAELTVLTDNSPLGHVYGTVVVSGRVTGARVRLFEYDGEQQGTMLGQAVTDDQGTYSIEVAPTTQATLLVEVDNPTGGAGAYTELSNGSQIDLGSGDKLRSVLTGWHDGDERTDGTVSPYTHVCASFAHGLWIAEYAKDPLQFPAAVTEAFEIVEEHFADGGPAIRLRATQPTNLAGDVPTNITAQVRYALVIAGLGEVADGHAEESNSSPATMNTLTLTGKLALDLGDSYTGTESARPLWDGKTGSGPINHGAVTLDSYVTRLELAIGVAKYLQVSGLFSQLELGTLLDRISLDERDVLYPVDAPGGPFDTVPPNAVDFIAPTPVAAKVLRGTISLKAQASDNHGLKPVAAGGLVWGGAAAAAITDVFVNDNAGPLGPWFIVGTLNTDAFPEGALGVDVIATDAAGLVTSTTRSFTLDRTAPTVSIATTGMTPTGPLAEGGFTGQASIVLTGSATDAHFQSASYTVTTSVGTSAATPLTVAAGGAWQVTVALANGQNTIRVTAVDAAGNSAFDETIYNRDATPPSVSLVAASILPAETAVLPPVGSINAATYTLGGSPIAVIDGVAFTKYASNYGPNSSNLPAWCWSLADDHTAVGGIVLKARLMRSATVLKDWFIVTGPGGTGYARSQVLSSALHADIALLNGVFSLEFQAFDEYNNGSEIAAVSWNQALRAPPIRQRTSASGVACSSTDGDGCPNNYFLGGDALGGTANAEVLVQGGGGLTDGKPWVARAFVDNPNDVAVRVKFAGTAQATYSLWSLAVAPTLTEHVSGAPDDCSTDLLVKPHLITGECYVGPSPAEEKSLNLVKTGLFSDVMVKVNGVLLTTCSGCAATEREIPAHTTATVYVRSAPWTFLWPYASTLTNVAAGDITAATGVEGSLLKKCLAQVVVDEEKFCTNWASAKALRILNAAGLAGAATVSVTSRPAAAGASFGSGSAEGAGTSNLAYQGVQWCRRRTGVTTSDFACP